MNSQRAEEAREVLSELPPAQAQSQSQSPPTSPVSAHAPAALHLSRTRADAGASDTTLHGNLLGGVGASTHVRLALPRPCLV